MARLLTKCDACLETLSSLIKLHVALKEKALKIYKNKKIVHTTTIVTSILSGLANSGAAIATFFTAGLAAPLLVASIAGRFASVTTNAITDSVTTEQEAQLLKQIQLEVGKCNLVFREFAEELGILFGIITRRLESINFDESEIKKMLNLMDFIAVSAKAIPVAKLAFLVTKFGISAAMTGNKIAMKNGGKVIGLLAIPLEVAFISYDIFDLTKMYKNGSAVANKIQAQIREISLKKDIMDAYRQIIVELELYCSEMMKHSSRKSEQLDAITTDDLEKDSPCLKKEATDSYRKKKLNCNFITVR